MITTIGHDLGHGDDLVDGGRLLDAAQDHEMERPDADQDTTIGRRWCRRRRPERTPRASADQHPVEDVADARADPVAEGRQEAQIVAESSFCVGEYAGVDVGPLSASDWNTRASMYMPVPAIGHAMSAPKGPVARREPAGQVEDTRADHRADDHGDQRRKRQLLHVRRTRQPFLPLRFDLFRSQHGPDTRAPSAGG